MTDWSTLKKLIWLRIIKGGGSAVRTVTGAIVHVTNALALPAEALTVNVEPIQDLHGYDSPWPAGGGKNLFDETNLYHGAYNQSTGELNAESEKYRTAIIDNLPAGTYTFSTDLTNCHIIRFWTDNANHAVGSTRSTQTFTTETSGKVMVCFRNTSTTAITETFHVQIETGNEATSYAPHSNICPISGRTSATVTRCGKNLIDTGAYWTDGASAGVTYTRNADGSIHLQGTSTNSNTYRNIYPAAQKWILPVGTYKASGGTANAQLRINIYKADGTIIARVQVNDTPKNVIVTEETGYIVVVVGYVTSGTTADDTIYPQLELGSTASAYEPYAGNTYTIALGDTIYGGTLDVLTGKMLVDRIGKQYVDGDGTTEILSTRVSGKRRMALNNFVPGILTPASGSATTTAICTAFQNVSNDVSYNNQGRDYTFCCRSSGNSLVFYIEEISTLSGAEFTSAFREKLSKISPFFVYPLATPFEITLTPTQIEMLLGENNLWADAGDSTLTYYTEGEASTSEALGILLGGTYNNHGGADDASDDEALGILLGGS